MDYSLYTEFLYLEGYFEGLPKWLSDVYDAIFARDCPRIHANLSRFTGSISPGDAFRLLHAALEKGLPFDCFEAIVQKSPPVPEIVYMGDYNGLVDKAAYMDRGDVLSLFVERGASPNRIRGRYPNTPLEAALLGQSLASVEVLLRQPELDTSWTPQLLFQWARPKASLPKLEACIRAMAPRFTGWDPCQDGPLPIPVPMTPNIIADARNWPMLKRFCRESPIFPKDGMRVLQSAGLLALLPFGQVRDEAAAGCADALAALLESCPNLLQVETNCRALLRCFLILGEDARERLRPWVRRIDRPWITMDKSDWLDWKGALPGFWQLFLPDGPALAIDRWDDSIDYVPRPASALRSILDTCLIRGEGEKGRVSPLAANVLQLGNVPLIESLFQKPDGLLATEDPGALADFVLEADLPRAKRAAVLSYIHKEADYEL